MAARTLSTRMLILTAVAATSAIGYFFVAMSATAVAEDGKGQAQAPNGRKAPRMQTFSALPTETQSARWPWPESCWRARGTAKQ